MFMLPLFMDIRYMQAVVDEIVLANVNPLKVLDLYALDLNYNNLCKSEHHTIYIR